MGNPSQSYGASSAIWDHTVLPACYRVNVPRVNPSQTGRYSIYLPQRDGRLSWVIDLGCCLYIEMVYLLVVSRLSSNHLIATRPEISCTIC